jgi:hypothetical protein
LTQLEAENPLAAMRSSDFLAHRYKPERWKFVVGMASIVADRFDELMSLPAFSTFASHYTKKKAGRYRKINKHELRRQIFFNMMKSEGGAIILRQVMELISPKAIPTWLLRASPYVIRSDAN